MKSTLGSLAVPMFLLGFVGVGLSACVDVPITDAQLQADGQLRPDAGAVAIFSADTRAVPQNAQHIAVSAVLAPQAEGGLEDRASFEVGGREGDESVHLHLRGDGVSETLPLTIAWTSARGELIAESTRLSPSETMELAATRPMSRDDAGTWRVQVFADLAGGQLLLAEREFEVLENRRSGRKRR